MRIAPWLLVLASCRALPPPPAVPFHANTIADPVGEVTVSVVLGVVGQGIAGLGIGTAIRVERQETERTALGVELTGGYVDADGDTFWLFAARGYGKGTPRTRDWAAVTYGAGLAVLTTGMVTLNAHGGGAVSYYHAYFAPYLSLGIAGSLPLIDGRPFGHLTGEKPWGAQRARGPQLAGAIPVGGTPGPLPRLKADFFLYGSVGLGVPLDDTGNVPSLDLTVAGALRERQALVAVSLADTQH